MARTELSLSEDLQRQLTEFQDRTADEAERIIWRVLPLKVLHLQSLLTAAAESSSHPFHRSRFSAADIVVTPSQSSSAAPPSLQEDSSDAAVATKKRKLENGAVPTATATAIDDTDDLPRYPKSLESLPTNELVVSALEGVREEAEELILHVDKVKLWVNLMMPKVEDGDNFGVEVQEQVLAELHRAQDAGHNLLDQLKTYHLNRGKICSKILKYPHLPDYAEALKRHDERTFGAVRHTIHDLRSIYCVLMDMLHKNIQKIRAPKGNNREALY